MPAGARLPIFDLHFFEKEGIISLYPAGCGAFARRNYGISDRICFDKSDITSASDRNRVYAVYEQDASVCQRTQDAFHGSRHSSDLFEQQS